jgi:hypothetical protein
MAATGYTPIQLYYSTTAAAVPTAGNLASGELAINITDGKLYYKSNAGTVTLLASTAGASGDVVGPASSTDNALARFDTTTGKLIQNSVGILSDAGVLTGLTGITSSGSITFSSLTSGRVIFAGASGLLTDSSDLFWDNTNARLGIGTSSPAYRLDVLRNVNGANLINIDNQWGTSGANAGLQLTTADVAGSSTSTFTLQKYKNGQVSIANNETNAAANMVFTVGASERVRITSAGDVGIGTSSPVSQLTIYSSSGTASGQYNSPSTITLWNGSTAGDIGGTIAFGGSSLSTTAKTFFASISSSVYASDASGTTGRLIFSTKSTQGATTLTERMRINESGLVGIGTTNPIAKLQIESSGNGLAVGANNFTPVASTMVQINASGNSSSENILVLASLNAGVRATFRADGKVGLGTSTPLAALDVTSTAAGITDALVLANYQSGSGTGSQINFRGQRGAPSAQVEYGYIRATMEDYAGTPYLNLAVMGGVMGVGTITPNVRFEVASTNRDTAELSVYTSDTSGGRGQRMSFWRNYTIGSSAPFRAAYIANINNDDGFSSSNAQDMAFFTKSGTAEPAERVRILYNGTTIFGKTTADVGTTGFRIDGSGSTYASITTGNDSYYIYNTTTSSYRFYVTSLGTIYATNTTISAISDQRLKENVQDLDAGLDKIMALKPRKFDWKSGKGKDIKGDRGWIAQEFEQVFPDMIDTWKDPAPVGEEPYKSVRADLIPVLVKAMQEQQAIIESLKARLDAANL